MNETNQQTPVAQGKAEKVIKGTARLEKPSMAKKMVNFLFSDKIDSVMNYLAYYILGPSLKDLIFKMGTGALQMALFGGNSVQSQGSYVPGYGYQPARRDPIPYNNLSNPGYGYAQPTPSIVGQRMSLTDISFDTKDDAYTVLDRMSRDVGRYGKVRVADFYNYSGISGQEGNWALQGNGWYTLGDAHPVMRTDGRWIIQFPPVQSLR